MVYKEKLELKMERLQNELFSTEHKLFKVTPQFPTVNDEITHNKKTEALEHNYTYFCAYCGERVRRGAKRHKCGQIQNWDFENN